MDGSQSGWAYTGWNGEFVLVASLTDRDLRREMNGNTFRFKCKSLDGDRTITVTGTIDGAGLTLTWEKQVRNGGFPGADEERSEPRRPGVTRRSA